MVKHPKVIKKVQEEVRRVYNGKEKIDETCLHNLTYLSSVIKETLRLHPPGPLILPREAREEVEICGYKIKEKTRVIVNAWAIGRDPHHWTEPERFYPERFLNRSVDYRGNHFEYIPFGAGRRICPGMHYGISVVELALANLLYHFDWMIPNGKSEDLDMLESFGLTARRRNDLWLIPALYDP